MLCVVNGDQTTKDNLAMAMRGATDADSRDISHGNQDRERERDGTDELLS